ncbi:MAG: hypothetical protein ABIO39_05340 [Caulobacteraceae bacterium]
MIELPMSFHLGATLRRTFESFDETPAAAILRLAEELEAKFFAADQRSDPTAADH